MMILCSAPSTSSRRRQSLKLSAGASSGFTTPAEHLVPMNLIVKVDSMDLKSWSDFHSSIWSREFVADVSKFLLDLSYKEVHISVPHSSLYFIGSSSESSAFLPLEFGLPVDQWEDVSILHLDRLDIVSAKRHEKSRQLENWEKLS
ncbi:hypothetical protein K1719_032920 [Acacia pycnantha]|nr:hypothetical protein K1719_032920 [Acacia pycnantha]